MIRTMLLLAGLAAAPAFAQDAPAEGEAPVEEPPPTLTVEEALAPLEAAYQKEFAYLSNERDSLEQRIAAQAREAERTKAEALADLDRLEARLTALQVQVENAETLLQDVDRAASSALEADDALEAAWFQASNSLKSETFELAEPETEGLAGRAAGFASAFEEGAARIVEGREVRVAPGSWFDVAGVETQGEVVTVGNVATFGVTGGQGVALVPVGAGKMHAFREGGGATGTALAGGTTADSMGLYLHEGRAKRLEDRAPKTLEDILEAGGVVGYVILGIGALALVLMILRALALMAANRGEAAVDAAVQAVLSGSPEAAAAAVQGASGSAPRVVERMVPFLDQPRNVIEDVANEALLRETPRIERFGSAILVIAAVAPLLGLLGTVTGMIATFDIITEFGTGDPRMLSGGISAALVTTQFGLIVAIPALLGGNLLGGWGDVVMSRCENAALRVLNALETEPAAEPEPQRMRATS